ncbi:MAG: hemolysin family protein [bacterium]
MLPPAVVPEFVALLALLAAAMFFNMSETAMIGVNRVTVRQRADAGDRRARRLDHMLDDPQRILSTVLVGNTIVTISAAALATAIAEQVIDRFPALIATVSVTVVVLVLCELVPKTLAVNHPLGFALALARPLRVVESILKPFIGLAGGTAKAITRLLGQKTTSKAPYITSDEIEMLVRMGVEGGEVRHFEQRVISDVFDFTETDVAKVMTPAAKVHWVNKDATLGAAAQLAAKHGHSRIIVADGRFDNVLGVVHIKDLLHYGDDELASLPVTLELRAVIYANHDLPADKLLVQMQKAHRLMAVIQDGYGRNLGIVTGDDLVEELVGEMHDEFDRARRRKELAKAEEAAKEVKR